MRLAVCPCGTVPGPPRRRSIGRAHLRGRPCSEGVRAVVHVCYYPDLSVAGAEEAIQSFTGLAVKSGVRRLVLLSGRGEPEAQRCEEIVSKSGVEWTLLRASWFAQNFSEAHFLDPLREGELALPVANIGEPFVDADDIADVAVAALTQDGHAGQLYELTGPRLWSSRRSGRENRRASTRVSAQECGRASSASRRFP